MFEGDICMKETPWSDAIFRILRICVLCTMAAPFYNQTKFTILFHLLNYFLLLLQLTSLLAFIPRERSEWAQCYSRDEKALSSSNFVVQSNIKVYEILSQPRDIWETVLYFEAILSFSVTTQITATKQTRLVIHSFKRKGRALYIWSLGLLTGLSTTAGCNYLGKTRKTVKCIGQKNPKNRHHWRKPKTKD